MAYLLDGVNLVSKVAGLGTASSWNGLSTDIVNGHYKLGGFYARAVKLNAPFMPFASFAVDGFLAGGERIFSVGKWAGVNRFVLKPTARWARSFAGKSSNIGVTLLYKGGGSYNSLGELRVVTSSGAATTISECPPVILVYAQAAGGNGGGSRLDGIFIGQEYKSGGGGGSGAFYAFYLELPFEATDFETVLTVSCNGSFNFTSSDGFLFLTVGAGSDGSSPTGSVSAGAAGGAGGKVSRYGLPYNVSYCLYRSLSDTSVLDMGYMAGLAGGKGGHAAGPVGIPIVDAESEAGGSVFKCDRFCIDAFGTMLPSISNYTGGAGGAGGGGGGGARSRFASGGAGGGGSSGWSASVSGSPAGGYGAGGGGGSAGGAGFVDIDNGGKGGNALLTLAW